MTCKTCKSCIRSVKIDARSGAIHQGWFCLKKKRNIKLNWYLCSVDCKHHKESTDG